MSTQLTAGGRRRLNSAGRYAAIAALGLVMAAPLIYLVSASLMSAADVRAYPPHLVPPNVVWHNYVEAYHFLSARVIVNSFVFSIGIVAVQLAVSLPAGFALAKIPFRWTAAVLGVLVVPMFVPGNMTLIPLFIVTHQLGLVGTYAGMILPIAGQTAFATLLFRQSFTSLPAGLIEAARMDGASWLRVLASIAVPLAKPALAAYCSISFLTAWNTYIWPQVVAPDPAHQVMTVALAPLASGKYSLVSPSVGLAAAVISLAPVLAIFLLFQKWYIKGIVGTGVD
ncbi:carbohydrate ABC transporter permease [Kribbella qitaiheensis]|uniref:Carbohydrate ABC transporter permease n=1 Tax=Kribbella qitaiheensis TaxID=1544730 RepID=A0A7G6WRU9_9ACTN|nr:carbohydrate ABC transporter permease [Kribbella qitaiheensis]QNE16714.1 carbohydrate ABC transporter permease [Kribbella qitaiheensis]